MASTEDSRGPVVVDTDVYSSRLIPNSRIGRAYEPILAGRVEFVSAQRTPLANTE